ncbi:MAG: hypothetical protein HYR80_00395, partial [Nitrospirae bacterium]|nr:hypothetical protein [Nitrospirota bacterium]
MIKHQLVDAKIISVDRIFLNLENPRHKPYQSEAEVIEYLCRDEYVYELAKDISKHGLNPLELFALIPLDGKKDKQRAVASYTVAEGNRRMCAIRLLNDPDRAPTKQRKAFEKLAEKSPKISEVLAVIFDDKNAVDIWLDRIHGGLQGGIGRKPWNAEQKTRHIGDKKNILAQVVLDYAEKNHLISAQDREGKITTVQRYLGNAILRETMGLDTSNLEDISRNRPKPDFDLLLKKFIADLLSDVVNSRSNSKAIKEYSRTLGTTDGLTGRRTDPESLSDPSAGGTGRKRKTSPKKPDRPKNIRYEADIHAKLKAIPSYKMETIYYSICDISLENHTPLISVGAWSFFECLTSQCGRNSATSFNDFLSKQKLNSMGFSVKEDVNSIRQ